MKKTALIFYSAAVAGACMIVSCNNGSQSNKSDSVETAKDINEKSNMTLVDEKDAKFAVDVADGGKAEIELGKTAEQKTANAKIKQFASMLVSDHTKAADELRTVATDKNITLPMALGQNYQDDITKLSQKTGKDFDKSYMDMMISNHKKTIDLFEKEANDGKDSTLKNWAANMLPTLRQHLDSAKAIRDMLK